MHNRPHAERDALTKTCQRFVAARAGLSVPRSLVTTIPGEALAFVDTLQAEGRDVIYKLTLSHPEGPPTRLFEPHDRDRIETLRFAPTLFQEFIVGGVDVRIAVVGDAVFAAEWRPAEGPRPVVDVRLHADMRMWAMPVSTAVRDSLLHAQRAFGLSIGIYDFKLDADGRPWFLEVNPSGQWLDLEFQAGHPVSAAVARLLTGMPSPATLPALTATDVDRRVSQAEACAV